MAVQLESKEYFDAREYLERLSDYSDEEADFVDAQESSQEDGLDGEENKRDSLLIHKLAFDGHVDKLQKELKLCSEDEKIELDPQGNTILHIGILRNNEAVLKAAFEAGISSKARNARGWSALDEASAAKSRDLITLLYHHQLQETKLEMQKAKALLMQSLQEMPDYTMELSWQLGSPVIGYLLRKFAPHDTYKIYKVGTRIRVDGTLMGVDKNSSSIIPEWKRGRFSLLFDGNHRPSKIFLIFHETKEYLDLTEEKQERKKTSAIESDIDLLLSDNVGKTKLRAVDLRFKPIKGWLTSQQTEKIENWNTVIYEASGKLMAITRLKSNLKLPEKCTFDEYLKLCISEDTVLETAVDPSNLPNQAADSTPGKEVDNEKKGKAKKISGRCWMAEDFPMSLRHLLPLLDVVGHANKQFSRVSKFMRKYGDMNMFPVKIQVPLLLTVYLQVSFKKFKFTTNKKISMELPKGYTRIKLEDVLSSAALGDLEYDRISNSDEKQDLETFKQLQKDSIEFLE